MSNIDYNYAALLLSIAYPKSNCTQSLSTMGIKVKRMSRLNKERENDV